MDYQEFLKTKQLIKSPQGFEVSDSDIHPALFDFQKAIVKWAVKQGRAAILADVGLGKTPMLCEWARQLNVPTLILAPLAVAQQTVEMAKTILGMDITYVRSMPEVHPGQLFYITNYEMIDHFDASYFKAVVLDECFAPDTLIDCIDSNGLIYQKCIEKIQKGDRIINASGIDIVSDIHRREVKYAIRIRVNGKPIISSPNHPYFTQRGWKSAKDLQNGDVIISTNKAMRMVRGEFSDNISPSITEKILQSILLCEMAHETARNLRESSFSRSGNETRSEKIGVVQTWQSRSVSSDRAIAEIESNGKFGDAMETLPNIEIHEARTFRAWGQWDWLDRATVEAAGGTWEQLEGGICFITGETNSWLSNVLQVGFGECGDENSHRGGWSLASEQETEGFEEGREADFFRVESLEILELGHPDLDKYRDAQGKLYFYDIGATQHPSFSIGGALVHNSSVLKAFSGVTKKKLVKLFKHTPYKLCCTATPAPNDIIEIGNHAEFLGVMNSNKMTSIFFIHDSKTKEGAAGKYRLKKHAKESFYQWLASWAVALKKPSDLGFSDEGYELPPVNLEVLTVDSHYTPPGMLPGFYASNPSAIEAKKIRRATIEARAKAIATMINGSDEQWLIWTALNDEAELLAETLEDSVNVHGGLSLEAKVKGISDFVHGQTKVLITKASIAGMGINMQNCHNMLFFGIDFSWESYYQCIGRIVRFGQKADKVNIYIVTSQQEISIYHTIEQKGKEAQEMTKGLIKASKKYVQANILNHMIAGLDYKEAVSEHDKWTLYLGDSCQVMPRLEDECVDLIVYSPPFSSIYIYTAIPEDLGNVMDYEQFLAHYNYIVKETYRLLKPGCIAAVHIQDFKLYANRDGARGIYPMSDDLVKLHLEAGFTYRARITIDKDPQLVATRNHDTDLLFVTGKRDSTDLAPMHTDYLLIFKKEGDREKPVKPYESGEMNEEQWISWARAVWYDIRETDVLNTKVARASEDERHICPLQLGLIERVIKMWSNKGEVVFSPFAGIGSELYEAVRLGRYGLGVELKPEYHKVACQNIGNAEKLAGMDLFAWAASQQQELLPE